MAENKPQNAPAAEERELTEKEIGEQRQIKRKKLEELRNGKSFVRWAETLTSKRLLM